MGGGGGALGGAGHSHGGNIFVATPAGIEVSGKR